MLNLKRRTRWGALITLLLIMVVVMVPGVQAAQSPVVVAGEITNKGDYSLTFDLAIANPAGTEGQFTVTVDGTAVKVTAVENTNTVGKIKLSLEKKASSGQVVVVEYVK
ncbi:MAG: SwmB domain-containing protein, partial [Syntrophomonadaceae bacterium]